MELHHIMMLIHHKLYDSYKLYYCHFYISIFFGISGHISGTQRATGDPKGRERLQLEVGVRRAPKPLVYMIFDLKFKPVLSRLVLQHPHVVARGGCCTCLPQGAAPR